jgi:hypothetical protein
VHGRDGRSNPQVVRAGRLMLAGETPAEAANAVGVARQTAYTWKARLDEGGIDALRPMATRRPAQLDGKQLDGLRAALAERTAAVWCGARLTLPAIKSHSRSAASRQPAGPGALFEGWAGRVTVDKREGTGNKGEAGHGDRNFRMRTLARRFSSMLK